MPYNVIFNGADWCIYFNGVFLFSTRKDGKIISRIKMHAEHNFIDIDPDSIVIPEEIENY